MKYDYSKKFTAFIISIIMFSVFGKSQTNTFPSSGAAGIGTTTPNASAKLEIISTSKGLLIPRMTLAQRNAITSPANGLLIYQTNNTTGFYYYSGTAWAAVATNGWSLTGNAGTTPGTNFLGTTDAKPLMFKVNNVEAGYIDYGDTLANTAFGYQSLFSNTTGLQNTAIGRYSLYSDTTGSFNSGFGYQSLSSNTTGYENTAIGDDALAANTTGHDNTAIGVLALYENTTGINNTAIGANALFKNITGTSNTAIGYDAMISNTTGNNNTTAGAYSDAQGCNGATAIGYLAKTDFNNKIEIGTSSNTGLTGGYGTWQSFSDGRFKENVQNNVPGLAFINKLHPVTYHLNAEKIDEFLGIKQRMDSSKNAEEKTQYLGRSKEVSSQVQTGFIAQEVEATAKSIGYDFDGVHHPGNDKDNYTIGYASFVVPLVKAVQELSVINDKKDSTVASLNSKVDKLQSQLNSILNKINSLEQIQQQCCTKTTANSSSITTQSVIINDEIRLEQNIPNPFNHTTSIGYTLPQKFMHAQIVITDKAGKTLKQINISGAGKGRLNVDASTLSSGAYQYSLIVDGRLISTKQMIIAK